MIRCRESGTLINAHPQNGARIRPSHPTKLQGAFRLVVGVLMLRTFIRSYGGGRPIPRLSRADPEGIDAIEEHLTRPELTDESGNNALDVSPPNRAAIARLRNGDWTQGDQNFYAHELLEKSLMDQGMSWEDAHNMTLEQLGHKFYDVYPREVIEQFPEWFNKSWFDGHGIERPGN